MRETEDEFVYHAINAHGSADEFQGRIVRVVEDEVVQVELAQSLSSNAAGQLGLLIFLLSTAN